MQLAAYQASPNLYMLDKKLQVMSEGLSAARKYVLGIGPDQLEVWWNFMPQRSVTGGLNLGN
jgi:hypothetical protein